MLPPQASETCASASSATSASCGLSEHYANGPRRVSRKAFGVLMHFDSIVLTRTHEGGTTGYRPVVPPLFQVSRISKLHQYHFGVLIANSRLPISLSQLPNFLWLGAKDSSSALRINIMPETTMPRLGLPLAVRRRQAVTRFGPCRVQIEVI